MMEIELGNVQNPVRKLRKSLKTLPKDPPVEEVHHLRTRARRLEAIVAALMLGHKKMTRRLLKTIKPVRKAAGEVRDMDVLVENALALPSHHRRDSDDSVARLLEHLGSMRTECARGLLDTVAAQGKDARRALKRFSRQLEKRSNGKNPGAMIEVTRNWPHQDAALNLIAELNRWPGLNAENLHAFRLKVKELRYILQLDEHADPKFMNALGTVKDQIGDWHDWQQLAKIAQKVLDPQDDRAALKKIEAIGKKKFNQALASAHAMRTRYLNACIQTGYGRISRTFSHSA
jgi:CHAD domain-containing protein